MNELEKLEKNLDSQRSVLVRILQHACLSKIPLFMRPLLLLMSIGIPALTVFKLTNFSMQKDKEVVIPILLAGLWLYVGQLLIYRHHKEVYTPFWLSLFEFSDIQDKVVHMNEVVSKKFGKIGMIMLFAWELLIVVALIANLNKMVDIGIVNHNILVIVVFIFICIIAGYLTFLGVEKGWEMMYTINALSKDINCAIPFDITNEDGIGNYSIIEKYSFKTTLYLSSGILFIPALNLVAKQSDLSVKDTGILVWLIMILFSLFMLISLFYPLIVGYRMAINGKNNLIYETKKRQIKLIDEYIENVSEGNKDLIDILECKLECIRKVPVYPFKIGIIIKFVSVILLPILSYLAQIFLTQENIYMLADFFVKK